MKTDIEPSQSIKALLGLRGMIMDGRLRPGARVLEQTVVDELAVSRTPARTAILRLCAEGLIEAHSSGNYAVAQFSEADVFDSIAIRGNLEGMAARLAAERGCPDAILRRLLKCVSDLDVVIDELEQSRVDLEMTEYARLNDQFHALLVDASQSNMVKKSLERLTSLPFAAPNAFIRVFHPHDKRVLRLMALSQEQHRGIVEAIESNEGARAEALGVEHARSAWKYLRRVLDSNGGLDQIPCMKLVVKD